MIKIIFLSLLKIIGVFSVLLIIAIGCFVQRGSGVKGYRINKTSVTYYYKKNMQSWLYSKTSVIGADASTFEILKDQAQYGKDNKQVYFKGIPLKNSDPATFSTHFLFGMHELCKDKQHVYYKTNLVSQDAENFKKLGKGYFKDRYFVYQLQTVPNAKYDYEKHFVKLNNVDPKEFTLKNVSKQLH